MTEKASFDGTEQRSMAHMMLQSQSGRRMTALHPTRASQRKQTAARKDVEKSHTQTLPVCFFSQTCWSIKYELWKTIVIFLSSLGSFCAAG